MAHEKEKMKKNFHVKPSTVHSARCTQCQMHTVHTSKKQIKGENTLVCEHCVLHSGTPVLPLKSRKEREKRTHQKKTGHGYKANTI